MDEARGPDRDQSVAAQQAVAAAVRFWWISVVRGSLAVLLGVGALISGASQQALVNFIAIYWLLGGLLTARWAHGVRWRTGSRIGLAAGVLGVGTGLMLLARSALVDLVSAATLIGVVALTIAATGCLRMVGAFEIEERTGRRWTIGGLVLGSVEVVLGTVLFVLRNAQSSVVRFTIGVWALVAGCLLLAQGIGMWRQHRGQ